MDRVVEAQVPNPVLPEPARNADDARAAGYAHRIAIAKRFAQRIQRQDAVFMSGAAAAMDMPRTISGGVQKSITGFNRWMLLQVMNDKGWTDPRFFTPKQIEAAGWSLKHDAQPVVLQYVKTTDQKGLSLAVPEVQRFAVYNAGVIDGAGEPAPEPKLMPMALVSAMAESDFEPTSNLVHSLSEWVEHHYQHDASLEGAQHHLVQSMAVSAVLSEFSLEPIHERELLAVQQQWARPQAIAEVEELLALEPAAFFEAVRVAEQVSGHVLSLSRIAHVELNASTKIDKEQGAAAMQTTQAPESNPAVSAGLSAYAAKQEERFANRQAVLAVPHSEKDKARMLGAAWYQPQRVWYVPEGVDVSKFVEWDPRKHHLGKTASTDVIIAEFEKEIAPLGLDLDGKSIIADGNWHNVRVTDKKGKNTSGAYLLNLATDPPTGHINNKFSGLSHAWVYDGPLLTPEQRARMRAEAVLRAQVADKERAKAQDQAAGNAVEILSMATPAYGHAYAQKKGMNSGEMLQVPGRVLLNFQEFYGESGRSAIKPEMNYLVIPMQDRNGVVRAVQAIGDDGSKSFMRGGQKKGTMTVFGAKSLAELCERITQSPDQLYPTSFVEGFATGASQWAGTGEPVVVCWDAGNLEAVVTEVASSLPQNMVPIMAVDNDQFHVERALGYLSSRLGVNPNSDRGTKVEVFSGLKSTRLVSLGDAIADGDWHQAPGGRYRMNLVRENDSTEVNAIELESVLTGQEQVTKSRFGNRGVEAGFTALKSLEEKGHPEMLALLHMPEFKSLHYRPTDWNDMHKMAGLQAVHGQFQDCLKRAGLFKEPSREQALPREVSARSAQMER
jgi:phage/plasmid primase-like uncharacterized protein